MDAQLAVHTYLLREWLRKRKALHGWWLQYTVLYAWRKEARTRRLRRERLLLLIDRALAPILPRRLLALFRQWSTHLARCWPPRHWAALDAAAARAARRARRRRR